MTAPVVGDNERPVPTLLDGVPVDLVLAAYAGAPGNEIESGKFASPESSAALAANAFGWFLNRPGAMPIVPGTEAAGWPAVDIRLEAIVRFPWSGGRHPCLDALITTNACLIGVESKRYEPWRAHKATGLSEAYWRPVWGEQMRGYERVRDCLRDGSLSFRHLDAGQLVKHAFGLRTEVRRGTLRCAVLVYVYAEPPSWPDGRPIDPVAFRRHREEILQFAETVIGDEVRFAPISYGELLDSWRRDGLADLQAHLQRLRSWASLSSLTTRPA